ncbi:MAG: hypothetical protein IJZ53_10535 [Tyzzerella sp.]|nr:hypothetical protein [Tyzzerella sp.]
MSIWPGYKQEGLSVKEENVVYYDVRQTPFKIYGFWNPQINFHRMPDEVAEKASGAVAALNTNSAGGRIRFCTDSRYVAIRIKHAPYNHGTPGISRQGHLGVDMYIKKDEKDIYHGSFMPPVDMEDNYEGILYIKEEGMHQVTLCMPYAKEVYDMQVGIEKGSVLEVHTPYKNEVPIVFYGSSITQGASASRPGNSYENFISRKLDCNYINLGFSGSAMGETVVAEYISGLSMSAFVMDYDHNAPNTEHLQKTHEQFYKIIRAKNPELPILLLTKPDVGLEEENQARRAVIIRTFLNARENGDKHIYFLDGYNLFPNNCRRDCTVDDCHPNDLGMYFIAERIAEVLREVL